VKRRGRIELRYLRTKPECPLFSMRLDHWLLPLVPNLEGREKLETGNWKLENASSKLET